MIKVSTEYYNKKEAELFMSYPNYKSIDRKIQRDISILKSEFLATLMFTEQADEDGWRTYEDLRIRVQHRLGDIEDILDFSKSTVNSKQSSRRMMASGLTERLGVSLGLNIVNQFHGLSEADWAITSDKYKNGKRLKDFDYEISIASDGEKFIQVENKGSVCDDNTKKNSSVSQQYTSIKKKKKEILEYENEEGIPRHQNIYYGTIGVVDNQNTAKVWLVDPEPFYIDWSPLKFKIIARLSFYANLFNEIGVHDKIVDSLIERIEKLKASKDIESFNKVPLKGIKSTRTYVKAKNFVKINTTEAFGSFFFVDTVKGVKIYLVAITKVILKLVISQDFESIINYVYKNAELSEKVIIEMSAKLSEKDEDFEMIQDKFTWDSKRKKFSEQYYSLLESTSSGRIFGLVD